MTVILHTPLTLRLIILECLYKHELAKERILRNLIARTNKFLNRNGGTKSKL